MNDKKNQKCQQWCRCTKVSDSAIFRNTLNCSRHRAGPAGRSSPCAAPLLPAHATQVAGGLGLSLTAANYRLTRPRCALHDCISPRSGYPERGRDGEWRRERWLGRIEKDGGGREKIESGRKDRGGEGETEEKNRRDEWEKRRGERRVRGREAFSGGTSMVD